MTTSTTQNALTMENIYIITNDTRGYSAEDSLDAIVGVRLEEMKPANEYQQDSLDAYNGGYVALNLLMLSSDNYSEERYEITVNDEHFMSFAEDDMDNAIAWTAWFTYLNMQASKAA